MRGPHVVDEQQIPAEMEWDGADEDCVHALAVNRFGVPLATGRLLEHVPGVANIGRMAVLKEGVSLQSLVDGLNALGVGPRDIISILQAIKAAGALQADIQVIG